MKVLRPAAALVLISAAVLWRGRQQRYLLFGWLWFAGVLVPTIGIRQAGVQAMADRFAPSLSQGLE